MRTGVYKMTPELILSPQDANFLTSLSQKKIIQSVAYSVFGPLGLRIIGFINGQDDSEITTIIHNRY